MRSSKTFAVASTLFILGASGLAFTPSESLPACTSDDAANAPCYWDAATMGNGKGDSFTVDSEGVVRYG